MAKARRTRAQQQPARQGGLLVIFPTALPEGCPAAAGRTPGPIEAWLRRGGKPERFPAVRHRFEVRDEAGPGVNWAGLDLQDDDLGGFDLRGADFAGCGMPDITAANLCGANLRGATIHLGRGATFDEACLEDAELEFAQLDAASFRGANLRGAILAGAGLRRAALAGADLTDADLCEADLTGSTIHLARTLEGCDLFAAFGLDAAQQAACRRLGALRVGLSDEDQ